MDSKPILLEESLGNSSKQDKSPETWTGQPVISLNIGGFMGNDVIWLFKLKEKKMPLIESAGSK